MIRTHVLPCNLPKEVADGFNRESGRIYTQVLVTHWRVFRHNRHWLSHYGATKYNDWLNRDTPKKLYAHTIDAAQNAFYNACTVTRALRKAGIVAKFPHRKRAFRTTTWFGTALKRDGNRLTLSNGRGNPKVTIALPDELRDVLRIMEVRLVYDKASHRYHWHIVVENGKQPKSAPGTNTVSVDLGEVHPAVVGDEHESVIVTGRELRHAKQGHAKRLAKVAKAISRTRKGSSRSRRLRRAKARMIAKHKRVVRDIEHKVSRAVVSVAVERKAGTIVVGDVRDAADGVALGKRTNQKIGGWSHGKVRSYIEYKAQAEGIAVVLQNEAYTSQTCPNCGDRHKPRGRVYRCPSCGFQSHRDAVGQVNILSAFRHGVPGKIPVPPVVKHRMPHNLRLMRRRRDTGQSPTKGTVAHG